ncbi:MAG TPA: TetR/AcrR family transcriptional regulator [Xanthobacteraceae bacterium]|nr:TetR/AcrR family transcriptional regulator [Xanthobacteraceae bacterium]
MVRKPEPRQQSNREKIIEALMSLLVERPIEDIGFGDLAKHAHLTLAQCRAEFGSVMAVLAAHSKHIDQQVLAGGDADMAEEPPRERLFDVLMRRLEALSPHKEATRSLLRSARRDPAVGLALNAIAVRSLQWMLTAADIKAAGPRGALRAQGLAVLYASVLRTWVNDDDPGLARTMAALDRGLARAERWSNLLDDLCRFSPLRCRPRERHGRRRGRGESAAAA